MCCQTRVKFAREATSDRRNLHSRITTDARPRTCGGVRVPAAYAECVRRGRREDRVCLPPSQRDPVDLDQAVAHLQAAVGGAAGRDLRHEILRVQDQAQGALASGDGYAELFLGRRRAGIAGRAPARACTGT
eukprot:scaffold122010_cov57-Phaeocystis_antarctica.AAC.3